MFRKSQTMTYLKLGFSMRKSKAMELLKREIEGINGRDFMGAILSFSMVAAHNDVIQQANKGQPHQHSLQQQLPS